MLKVDCSCTLDDRVSYEDCKKCDFNGLVDADPEMLVFVNAYRITREYGGAEEGGWYYDHYTCIETYPVRNKLSDSIVEYLEEQHKGEKYGDISSVLGGADVQVMIEDEPKKSETKGRPHYE